MAAHPVGGIGVERGGGLIEQQNLRRIDERLRQRDAGLLASGQLAGGTVETLREVELRCMGREAERTGKKVKYDATTRKIVEA